jgi:formate dehydrogenase subunit gamma
VATIVHSIAAVLIILTWIVHVYAAIWTRGTLRAMTVGTVTGGWAWRHHRKWLRELARLDRPGPAE